MSDNEWLEWRRHGIGGSDVAAVMGVSPWASPWSVWANKCGLTGDIASSEVMEAGKFLELAITPWFTDRTGLGVVDEQAQIVHPSHSHHRATLDGLVYGDDSECLGVLEIKTTNWGKPWETIPEHYQAQVQWQLHVTGLGKAWMAVLMGRRLDIHEIERDQDAIDKMVAEVDRFWAEHVRTGTPPPVDGSDATAAALAEVFPGDTEVEAVEVDVEAMVELRTLQAFNKAAADTKKAITAIKSSIRAKMGDGTEAAHNGKTVATLRPQTKKTTCKHCGVVDESAPFRVLRITKETNND